MALSISEMETLAGGDLTVEISRTDLDHEFGQMARALEVFRDNAQDARRLAEEQAEAERKRIAREEE